MHKLRGELKIKDHNAVLENEGTKGQGCKLQDQNLKDQIAWVENEGPTESDFIPVRWTKYGNIPQ